MREITWRRWLAVGLLGIIGLAAGIVVASKRKPVYSSTATISSARVNVLAEALPGYVSAATSLASTYARITMSDAVEVPVARRLGLPLPVVQARLSAAPVPDDPIVTVIGTGRSPHAARQLVSAAASSLVSYVSTLADSPAAANGTLAQYSQASAKLQRLNDQVSKLRANGGRTAGAALKTALSRQSQTSLSVRALGSSYISQSLARTSGASPQVLSASTAAASDRRSKLEDFGLIGLAVGLIVGLLAERATGVRARQRRRRAVQHV